MDDTRPIRQGEELNEKNLAEYLRESLNLAAGEVEISQFPGGSSNLTYCVRVGAEEYVLRRPPFGNQVKSAHDMSREFNVLSKLSKVYAPAPKPLVYCGDEAVIGSEFYLMQRRHGLIIRGRAPEELESAPGLQKKVVRSFVANLVELHSLDFEKIGLGDLGKPEGYVVRQTQGWTRRYFNARTDEHAEQVKFLRCKVFEVVATRARAANVAGATILQALVGFGHTPHQHRRHVLNDDRSVVIEIVDEESKLRAFVASLSDLEHLGPITLQDIEVLHWPAAADTETLRGET